MFDFNINEITTGLFVWFIGGLLSLLSKRFTSYLSFSPYFFAIVIISVLFIINIVLFQFNFGFNLNAYIYATVFSILFLLTHTLIWMRRSIPKGSKRILKLFSKTGKEVLYEEDIRSTLNLSIHKFNYFMDSLVGEYVDTDSEYFVGKRKYWLLPDGRSYLAKRFSLK